MFLGSLQGRSESPDVNIMMRMKLIMIMIMRLALKVVALGMMSGQECERQATFSTWRESLGGAARAGDIGPGNKTGC